MTPPLTKKKKMLMSICAFLLLTTNKGGKKQIIIVKNLSSVGRIFKHLQTFSSSEIYNLEWDGMGMAENWQTKKINGYVADYCIKDVDNDGNRKLCWRWCNLSALL